MNTDRAAPFPAYPRLLVGKRALAQGLSGKGVMKVLLLKQKDVSSLIVPWEIREEKTDNVLCLYYIGKSSIKQKCI